MRNVHSADDDGHMTMSEEIVALDEVAASLRAIASGDVIAVSEVAAMLAEVVSQAADRTQEVADLRAALALLSAPPAHS